jgi:hypothetical protein
MIMKEEEMRQAYLIALSACFVEGDKEETIKRLGRLSILLRGKEECIMQRNND